MCHVTAQSITRKKDWKSYPSEADSKVFTFCPYCVSYFQLVFAEIVVFLIKQKQVLLGELP